MSGLIVLGVAALVFLVVWHVRGSAAAAFLALTAGCALTTIDLFTFGSSTAVTAIAGPEVTIATYHVALLGGFLVLPRETLRNISPWLWLFLALLAVLLVVQGPVAPHTANGALLWGSAVLAWGIGGAIAQSAATRGIPTDRWVAVSLAVIIGWHAVIAGLQLAGVRAVSSIDVGAVEVARVSGTAGHSGNLGKVMFLLVILLLPVTRSTDRIARRWAVAAVCVAAGLTALSFSRANTVAMAVMIALWLALGPGIRLANRILVPIVACIVALPIIDILIMRNEYDPEGGSRPILLETAMRQISETLWWGVGPNDYLETVGRYDALAAGGLPVHSAFLLALAELGLVCVVLLAVPIVLVFARAFAHARRESPTRRYAVVAIGALPGIVIIGATGWGILHEQYLVLLLFVIGYLAAAQRPRPETAVDVPATDAGGSVSATAIPGGGGHGDR